MTLADPHSLETGVRDILSSLRRSADLDTCEVLASATNVYLSASLRFRGNTIIGSGDITALLSIWQTLLNVPKANPEGYAPKGKPQPGED